MTDSQKTMLAGLKRRKKEAKGIEKINNATLYAGSPMYYYCRLCGLLAATLPETHSCPAPRYCEPCDRMLDQAFDPKAGKFG